MHQLKGADARDHLDDAHHVDVGSNHMALIVHNRLPDHHHRPPAWMETSRDPEALARGQARERRALVNEHQARGDFLATLDLLALRQIDAIHRRIFDGPTDDVLTRV